MAAVVRLRRLAHMSLAQKRCFSSEPEILCTQPFNQLFRLTLNREKKLNSLTLAMMLDIGKHYDQTISKDSIVWLEGAGTKAFCAGGDVAAIVEALNKTPRDMTLGQEFFWNEYLEDYKLASAHERNTVNVSAWDKIVMGGGVGVGYHAPIRLVTEATMFAMPETKIGLFPDVGMTWGLSRLKGDASLGAPSLGVGRWLGLTGSRLVGGQDCLRFGVGTHFVEQKNLEQVFEHLSGFSGSATPETVRSFLETSGLVTSDPTKVANTSPKATNCFSDIDSINRYFSTGNLAECLAALQNNKDSEFAQSTLKTLNEMSPLSIKLSWEAITRHSDRNMTLRDALKAEYRMACHSLRAAPEADFQEGVTALLLEKRKPNWSFKRAEDVPDDLVESYFGPLAADNAFGEVPI